MFQIALCDDEKEELDKTENLLKSYREKRGGTEFAIRRFESAEALVDRIRAKDYLPDLILMDIYFPGQLGTKAAAELRDMGNEGRIIFLTASREHALEAFRVNAVQYVVKPASEEEFFPVLDRTLKVIEGERKKYLLLRVGGRIQRVSMKNIVCLEAQGKQQGLYLADGSLLTLHMTMASLHEILAPYREFVKAGVAYIINLAHIDSLNAKDVCMDTGKRIYLPRGTYKPLKREYLLYYCEED